MYIYNAEEHTFVDAIYSGWLYDKMFPYFLRHSPHEAKIQNILGCTLILYRFSKGRLRCRARIE